MHEPGASSDRISNSMSLNIVLTRASSGMAFSSTVIYSEGSKVLLAFMKNTFRVRSLAAHSIEIEAYE